MSGSVTYLEFARAHEALCHAWKALSLSGIGASMLEIGVVKIHSADGAEPVWIRPVQNPNSSWKLAFHCSTNPGECYVEYLLRQGSGHRRHVLTRVLERYVVQSPTNAKFVEGLTAAELRGTGLVRVEKADRRAGRYPGVEVFGAWCRGAFPFRFHVEYHARFDRDSAGIPIPFASTPPGACVFRETTHGYGELPGGTFRDSHWREVQSALVQVGFLPSAPARGRVSARVARDSMIVDRGSDRMRSRSRRPRRGGSDVLKPSRL